MIKGVVVAFGIIIILALIPVVHFAGIPFGPFIGGYYGISSASHHPGSSGRNALIFGSIFGVLMLIMFVVGAVIVMLLIDFNPAVLWAGVVIVTLYYASMSALGAWYAGLRAGMRPQAEPGGGK